MPNPSAMTTVSLATLAGGGQDNQDHVVVAGRAVAVLDGASGGPGGEPRVGQGRTGDGGWYARALGAALTLRLEDPGRTLTEIVGAAITDLRDRHRLPSGSGPGCAVAIARWAADSLEVYVLGGGAAVVFPRAGEPRLIRDGRRAMVATAARAACWEHLRAGHGYDHEYQALLAQLRQAEREHVNRPGGYWIAAATPAAAREAVTATLSRADVRAVMIVSDGAAADVLEYGRNDWIDVYDLVGTADPAGYLRAVHVAEHADYDGRWWPRMQRHDDKTLALVMFDVPV